MNIVYPVTDWQWLGSTTVSSSTITMLPHAAQPAAYPPPAPRSPLDWLDAEIEAVCRLARVTA